MTADPALAPATFAGARLLVVDDERANLELMSRVLRRAGYGDVRLVRDPLVALASLDEFAPDLILLDLHMPGLDGFEVLRRLQETVPVDDFLPRLVITADSTPATRRRALGLGAHDFLTKPIDVTETSLRVANLLRTRMLHVRLQESHDRLEEQVELRTRQLSEAYRDITRRLALVGEYRDDATAEHTTRVGVLAARLGRAAGFDAEQVRLLADAAPLHDIGKVAIPVGVLLKPGPLSATEFDIIKTHAAVGAHILRGGASPLLRLAEQIAYTHHERWDGSGYPSGLSGQAIPLAGRLVAIVDVFDALTSARPYKTAWPVDRAVAQMRAARGRQFDPELLDLFLDQLHAPVAHVRETSDAQHPVGVPG